MNSRTANRKVANSLVRKGLALLLGGLLAVPGWTLATPSAKADTPDTAYAAFVGIDNNSKGHWNGKYGTDGYILFGYAATADPDNVIEVPKYEDDIVKSPSYLDPIDGHAYALNDGSRIKVRPLPTDETELGNILDVPSDGSAAGKVEAAVEIGDSAPPLILDGSPVDNGGRRTLTFHVNDDAWHLFTVYSTKELTYKYFGIQDLDGNDLFPLTKGATLFEDKGNNSSYVSFLVRGSFKLNYDGQWENIGLQGAFFDPYAPMGLTAQPQTDGSVSLDWSNRPGADAVLVERSADGEHFAQIASLPGDAASYSDADAALEPGQSYSYRLRYVRDNADASYTPPASATVQTPVQAEDPRAYLGTDAATAGHWYATDGELKYGRDGYILIGYNASVVPKPQDWSTIQADPANDLNSLPSYVDSYAYDPEGQVVLPPLNNSDRYYDYVIDMPPGTAVPDNPDEVVAGQPRQKYRTWARLNKTVGSYAFRLNDDAEHVFSMFAKPNESEPITIELQDADGRDIATQTVDPAVFNNGGYVSFLVRGSFKLVIHSVSQDFGASGFFFDPPLSDQPASFTAAPLPQRKAQLAWMFDHAPDKVIVERKQGGGAYAQLAVLDGTASGYTDANLKAGTTYAYRIRAVAGTGYGSASEPQTVEVPAMTPAALTLDSSDDINVTLGGTVRIGASLQAVSSDGRAPVEGETITFKLRGDHVGDGVTLGHEIPEVAAQGVTDANGDVQVTFAAEYAGHYTLVAATDPDDFRNLDGTESEPVALDVELAQEQAAPTIVHISDAVKPGALFTVNGAGLDEGYVDIAIVPAVSEEAPAAPPAGAVHPGIVQTDGEGQFVVAKLPDNAAPGVYDVWAKNANGWSAPYEMNAARPLFISDREAYSGVDIELAGRNLDQTEFGGPSHTKVRLNDGAGTTAEAAVKSLNPYGLTFTVGDAAAPGEYDVEVSNDNGVHWSRLQNGQTLTVVAAGDDPLGLDVGWAKDFNWSNRIDVSSSAYGANGSDDEDDTAGVQAAVDAAAADEGGGVVYFPAGSYYISSLSLPSGVVLLGEDTDRTKLIYTGTGQNFIDTIADTPGFTGVPERQGVARLSLLLSDPATRPDAFIWLGEAWGDSVGDMTLRKANRLFVADVDIDYPTDTDRTNGGRGLGLEFIAKERVLVQNNRFVGWHAQPFINYVSQYYVLRDNVFEYTEGYVVGVSTYAFYTGNRLKVVNPDAHKETHGLFARSNAYIADNTVENVGDTANGFNDGEPIAVEVPGGSFNYGSVLKATPTALTVAPVKALVNPKLEYGYLSVLIVGGKGMGQLRKVQAVNGYTLTLDRPFDIVPDNTSKFTLIAPNDNATIYHNTVKNNAKGIWLFGNSIDGVVADNTSVDSEGIFIWSARNSEGLAPDYYNRITGNTVSGVSPRSLHGGIGFNTGRNDNDHAFATDVYATEILHNTLSGDSALEPLSRTEAPPFGGIYASSATYSTSYDNVPGSRDSANTVIAGNALSDLTTGVNLTHSSYGQIVSGNRYDDTVLSFLDDTGSVNTLVENNEQATDDPTAPTNPTGPKAPSTPSSPPTTAPGLVQVQAQANDSRTAVAEVNADAIQAAAADGGDTIVIAVNGIVDARSIAVRLTGDAMAAALEQGISRLQIESGAASVSLAVSLLLKDGSAAGPVELSLTAVDPAELSEAAKHAIGVGSVYDIHLTVDGAPVVGFQRGDVEVSLDYQLMPGEDLNRVVIYYIDDEGQPSVVTNGRYDEATGDVIFSPTHLSRYAASYGSGADFTDLAGYSWAEISIEALAARDIVTGIGADVFAPGKILTRAEFVQMLMNAFEFTDSGAAASFSDVLPSAWYSSAVSSASRLGIVNGRPDGSFGPFDPVSRQDMAVMIDKAAHALNADLNSGDGSAAEPFTDQSAIADYALDAVARVRQAGIVTGFEDGSFAPSATATRAQAAAIVWRMLQAVYP